MDMNGKCTPPSWAGVDPRIGLLRIKRTLCTADDALRAALRVFEDMHGRVSQ